MRNPALERQFVRGYRRKDPQPSFAFPVAIGWHACQPRAVMAAHCPEPPPVAVFGDPSSVGPARCRSTASRRGWCSRRSVRLHRGQADVVELEVDEGVDGLDVQGTASDAEVSM